MFKALAQMFGGGEPRHALPDGMRVYAVGDIHGRFDLLETLLANIEADLAQDTPKAEPLLIFLGDYVDRGAQSRDVVERLITSPIGGMQSVFLKGNHEATLLDFLEDERIGPRWTEYGGLETITSYGVELAELKTDADAWRRIRDAFASSLPDTHLAFFKALKSYHILGPYLFVHAGVDPIKPFEEQTDADFLWVRDDFLLDTAQLPFRVVHGHTPQDKPHADNRRIGLDTHAYLSGVLTAARLEGGDVRFLQTGVG